MPITRYTLDQLFPTGSCLRTLAEDVAGVFSSHATRLDIPRIGSHPYNLLANGCTDSNWSTPTEITPECLTAWKYPDTDDFDPHQPLKGLSLLFDPIVDASLYAVYNQHGKIRNSTVIVLGDYGMLPNLISEVASVLPSDWAEIETSKFFEPKKMDLARDNLRKFMVGSDKRLSEWHKGSFALELRNAFVSKRILLWHYFPFLRNSISGGKGWNQVLKHTNRSLLYSSLDELLCRYLCYVNASRLFIACPEQLWGKPAYHPRLPSHLRLRPPNTWSQYPLKANKSGKSTLTKNVQLFNHLKNPVFKAEDLFRTPHISHSTQHAKRTIDLKTELPPKELRKTGHLWSQLSNIKRYLTPKSPEDNRTYSFWKRARITVGKIDHYLSDKLISAMEDFSSTVHEKANTRLAFNTVFQATLLELEQAMNRPALPDFITYLDSLSQHLTNALDYRTFYFPLHGLTLNGIEELRIADASIVHFTETHARTLLTSSDAESDYGRFEESVQQLLNSDYIGRTVIMTSVFGDRPKATLEAKSNIKLAIDYLRFSLCLLTLGRVNENLIRVSLTSEAITSPEVHIELPQKGRGISLSSGRGRRNLHSFEITTSLYYQMRVDLFLEQFSQIAFRTFRSQIEEILLTAIHWVGEAQNDHEPESAFLKYCIALESIFSEKGEEITKTLSKGIAVLLAFSGYRFIKVAEIQTTYKRMLWLYEIRSKIVHSGAYRQVHATELNEIASVATKCILSLFSLREQGYTAMSQIKRETDRLYNRASNIRKSSTPGDDYMI